MWHNGGLSETSIFIMVLICKVLSQQSEAAQASSGQRLDHRAGDLRGSALFAIAFHWYSREQLYACMGITGIHINMSVHFISDLISPVLHASKTITWSPELFNLPFFRFIFKWFHVFVWFSLYIQKPKTTVFLSLFGIFLLFFLLFKIFSTTLFKKCFLCFCYFTILKFGKTISKRLNKCIGMLSFTAVCIYTRWRSLNFEASSSKQQEDNHMTWLARVYVPSCRCLTSGLWEWRNPAYPAWAMGTRGTSTCLCFL